MKENKFRAWDNVKHKMLYGEEIEELDCYHTYLSYGELVIAYYDKNDLMSDWRKLEIMQYTGCKNLYENDICKTREGISKVVYCSYAFFLEGIDWFGVMLLSDRNVEVIQIGNIHENPELLKGDKDEKNRTNTRRIQNR